MADDTKRRKDPEDKMRRPAGDKGRDAEADVKQRAEKETQDG